MEPGEFEFAAIRDIAVIGSELFILDDIQKKVHHLNLINNQIQRVGDITIRQGNGPGELLQPASLAVSDSYIILSDARN